MCISASQYSTLPPFALRYVFFLWINWPVLENVSESSNLLMMFPVGYKGEFGYDIRPKD